MADPKKEIQATFEPVKRYGKYGDVIVRLLIKGFRNHSNTPIAIESPITAFCGVNGTGKSTILQLAAAAYKAPAGYNRFYVSSFILAGTLDKKPFGDNSSVEISYAQPTATDGKIPTRDLTVSRADSKWSGYDSQPERRVTYLGVGFHLPHSERDEESKNKVRDEGLLVRHKTEIEKTVLEKISSILLCNYDAAHQNTLRRKYARKSMALVSTKRRSGEEYSEANMGSGEARLYDLVTRIESLPEKSLVLVEEPETALHPSAQFRLGSYLVEVAKRRSLQIFITTHSEFILLALPQRSRIYLKRENNAVVPIPAIGVRQAMSHMGNLEIPALYILVEDDVAAAIVTELLRRHDADFGKTVKVIDAGDTNRIQSMMEVFSEQRLPVCAVRDGDIGPNKEKKIFSLFGKEAPEKEIFKSATFKSVFATTQKVDFDVVDVTNKSCADHHRWFDVLVKQMARSRSEILTLAAIAYLDGVQENERTSLVEQIKESVP